MNGEDIIWLAKLKEARAEYDAAEHPDEPCPHDELDHGICLSCGADCFDDVITAAEYASDIAQDR